MLNPGKTDRPAMLKNGKSRPGTIKTRASIVTGCDWRKTGVFGLK